MLFNKEMYKLNQNGKNYLISSELENNKIKLTFEDINSPITKRYINSFSLSDLKMMSHEFRACSNITQAHQLINEKIRQNQFIIRNQINHIDLEIFFRDNPAINFGLNPIYNNIYPYQVINTFNNYNTGKRIKREYLTLVLSPKRTSRALFNSPLRNYEQNQHENSPSSTSNSSNYSPTVEENNNINSPIINETLNSESNNNLNTTTKINTQENENSLENNQINPLNNEVERQKEINDLKNNNEQLKQENINLKNQLELSKMSVANNSNDFLTKGTIIKSEKELEFLCLGFGQNYKNVSINLIYKATADSDEAKAFHEKCDQAKSSLVLVETDKNARFGGFTSQNWSGNCINKKDDNAFVFSLNKLKIFRIKPGEDAIACYPGCGPVFLGCQIRIFDNAFLEGGTTYEKGVNYQTEEDYELTGGEQKFQVKEIEVYSIDFDKYK